MREREARNRIVPGVTRVAGLRIHMSSPFPAIRDAALDRAIAEPANARTQLAFAGAIDAAAGGSEELPAPVLVSMAAVPVARQSLEGTHESLVRGAALAVEQRAVTVGEVAAMADLPASTIADAVRTGCCGSSIE